MGKGPKYYLRCILSQMTSFSSSPTKADFQLSQALRSLATFCHLKPLDFANESKESSHLVAGRPGPRSPPCGIQFTMRVVHLPSVRRMTWPAHVHLRRRCSRTQSMILPDSMAVSMHRAVRFCHSIYPSSSCPVSRPSSPEFSLEVDGRLDEDDDDDGDSDGSAA